MTEYKLVPVDVVEFLKGSGELEGLGFGENMPGDGRFWWRKYLNKLAAAPAPEQQVEQAQDEREPVATWMGTDWNALQQLLAHLGPLEPGTDLYTAPPAAPDVSGLVKAAEFAQFLNPEPAAWRYLVDGRYKLELTKFDHWHRNIGAGDHDYVKGQPLYAGLPAALDVSGLAEALRQVTDCLAKALTGGDVRAIDAGRALTAAGALLEVYDKARRQQQGGSQ